MQLKIFVVPIKNIEAAEADMNAFLRGHRVLTVKQEFVIDGRLENYADAVLGRLVFNPVPA